MPPRPGQKVYVKTEVKQGAFPTEKLVTVTTSTGPVSGFAKSDNILEKDDGKYLLAEVQNVRKQDLTVRLSGSFFTTTGLADVSSSMVLKGAR